MFRTRQSSRYREIERRAQIANGAPSQQSVVRQLAVAADQFIVQRGELNSVIAGTTGLLTGAATR